MSTDSNIENAQFTLRAPRTSLWLMGGLGALFVGALVVVSLVSSQDSGSTTGHFNWWPFLGIALFFMIMVVNTYRSKLTVANGILTLYGMFRKRSINLEELSRVDYMLKSYGRGGTEWVMVLRNNQQRKIQISLDLYSTEAYDNQLKPVIKYYASRPNVQGNEAAQKDLAKY